MREMNLPALSVPSDHDEAIGRYRARMSAGLPIPIQLSRSLVAYMAWPEDEQERNTWVASVDGRQLALRTPSEPFTGFESITTEAIGSVSGRLAKNAKKWAPVADLLQMVIDLQYSNLPLLGGASISKAAELCADEASTFSVGHIHRLWSSFRNVAHLIAAGALLAREALENDGSIFAAAWYAPDSVLAIAAGFEEFALTFNPHGQSDCLLPADGIWRLPRHWVPASPWLRHRMLFDRQRELAAGYKAKKTYDRRL